MKNFFKLLNSLKQSKSFYALSTTGLVIGGYYHVDNKQIPQFSNSLFLTAYAATEAQQNTKPFSIVRTEKGSREERYLEFASVECNGVVYMTPADFLESVTQKYPRYRKSRRTVSEKEAIDIVSKTPSRRKGSTNLFRQIDSGGLISYTEYLFLLCVLTKPRSGFKIAFNMFDTDMNEEVDKKEFLVMERTMQHKKAEVIESLKSAVDDKNAAESWFLLKLLNKLIAGMSVPLDSASDDTKVGGDSAKTDDKNDTMYHGQFEQNIHNEDNIEPDFDTTMLVYFFGKKGRDKLRFKEFAKFMEDLQIEVLDIEFTEYSKGLKTISESEFARILLRYTSIAPDAYSDIINRVVNNLNREEGITFEDFKSFFQFLNNLDDFVLAMKMYTLADRPVSPQEFQQAVKATTQTSLSNQLVETLFLIFDQDGDGHLSYQEFIKVMKNRMNRGFSSKKTSSSKKTLWRRYKHCVSEEFFNAS